MAENKTLDDLLKENKSFNDLMKDQWSKSFPTKDIAEATNAVHEATQQLQTAPSNSGLGDAKRELQDLEKALKAYDHTSQQIVGSITKDFDFNKKQMDMIQKQCESYYLKQNSRYNKIMSMYKQLQEKAKTYSIVTSMDPKTGVFQMGVVGNAKKNDAFARKTALAKGATFNLSKNRMGTKFNKPKVPGLAAINDLIPIINEDGSFGLGTATDFFISELQKTIAKADSQDDYEKIFNDEVKRLNKQLFSAISDNKEASKDLAKIRYGNNTAPNRKSARTTISMKPFIHQLMNQPGFMQLIKERQDTAKKYTDSTTTWNNIEDELALQLSKIITVSLGGGARSAEDWNKRFKQDILSQAAYQDILKVPEFKNILKPFLEKYQQLDFHSGYGSETTVHNLKFNVLSAGAFSGGLDEIMSKSSRQAKQIKNYLDPANDAARERTTIQGALGKGMAAESASRLFKYGNIVASALDPKKLKDILIEANISNEKATQLVTEGLDNLFGAYESGILIKDTLDMRASLAAKQAHKYDITVDEINKEVESIKQRDVKIATKNASRKRQKSLLSDHLRRSLKQSGVEDTEAWKQELSLNEDQKLALYSILKRKANQQGFGFTKQHLQALNPDEHEDKTIASLTARTIDTVAAGTGKKYLGDIAGRTTGYLINPDLLSAALVASSRQSGGDLTWEEAQDIQVGLEAWSGKHTKGIAPYLQTNSIWNTITSWATKNNKQDDLLRYLDEQGFAELLTKDENGNLIHNKELFDFDDIKSRSDQIKKINKALVGYVNQNNVYGNSRVIDYNNDGFATPWGFTTLNQANVYEYAGYGKTSGINSDRRFRESLEREYAFASYLQPNGTDRINDFQTYMKGIVENKALEEELTQKQAQFRSRAKASFGPAGVRLDKDPKKWKNNYSLENGKTFTIGYGKDYDFDLGSEAAATALKTVAEYDRVTGKIINYEQTIEGVIDQAIKAKHGDESSQIYKLLKTPGYTAIQRGQSGEPRWYTGDWVELGDFTVPKKDAEQILEEITDPSLEENNLPRVVEAEQVSPLFKYSHSLIRAIADPNTSVDEIQKYANAYWRAGYDNVFNKEGTDWQRGNKFRMKHSQFTMAAAPNIFEAINSSDAQKRHILASSHIASYDDVAKNLSSVALPELVENLKELYSGEGYTLDQMLAGKGAGAKVGKSKGLYRKLNEYLSGKGNLSQKDNLSLTGLVKSLLLESVDIGSKTYQKRLAGQNGKTIKGLLGLLLRYPLSNNENQQFADTYISKQLESGYGIFGAGLAEAVKGDFDSDRFGAMLPTLFNGVTAKTIQGGRLLQTIGDEITTVLTEKKFADVLKGEGFDPTTGTYDLASITEKQWEDILKTDTEIDATIAAKLNKIQVGGLANIGTKMLTALEKQGYDERNLNKDNSESGAIKTVRGMVASSLFETLAQDAISSKKVWERLTKNKNEAEVLDDLAKFKDAIYAGEFNKDPSQILSRMRELKIIGGDKPEDNENIFTNRLTAKIITPLTLKSREEAVSLLSKSLGLSEEAAGGLLYNYASNERKSEFAPYSRNPTAGISYDVTDKILKNIFDPKEGGLDFNDILKNVNKYYAEGAFGSVKSLASLAGVWQDPNNRALASATSNTEALEIIKEANLAEKYQERPDIEENNKALDGNTSTMSSLTRAINNLANIITSQGKTPNQNLGAFNRKNVWSLSKDELDKSGILEKSNLRTITQIGSAMYPYQGEQVDTSDFTRQLRKAALGEKVADRFGYSEQDFDKLMLATLGTKTGTYGHNITEILTRGWTQYGIKPESENISETLENIGKAAADAEDSDTISLLQELELEAREFGILRPYQEANAEKFAKKQGRKYVPGSSAISVKNAQDAALKFFNTLQYFTEGDPNKILGIEQGFAGDFGGFFAGKGDILFQTNRDLGLGAIDPVTKERAIDNSLKTVIGDFKLLNKDIPSPQYAFQLFAEQEAFHQLATHIKEQGGENYSYEDFLNTPLMQALYDKGYRISEKTFEAAKNSKGYVQAADMIFNKKTGQMSVHAITDHEALRNLFINKYGEDTWAKLNSGQLSSQQLDKLSTDFNKDEEVLKYYKEIKNPELSIIGAGEDKSDYGKDLKRYKEIIKGKADLIEQNRLLDDKIKKYADNQAYKRSGMLAQDITDKEQNKIMIDEYAKETEQLEKKYLNNKKSLDPNFEYAKYLAEQQVQRKQTTERFKQMQGNTGGADGRGSSGLFGLIDNGAVSVMNRFLSGASLMRVLQRLRQAINKVTQEATQLNQAMTDMRIVTGKNEQSTKALMASYGKLGKQLGATTLEITNSAQGWARQGYELNQVNELVTASMYLSKLGMIDSATATKNLTSAMKGFKLEASQAMDVVDKLTALDVSAATTAGDISEGLSEFANLAAINGVNVDQASAYVATIADVMQASGSRVGQSLKMIMSRFGNVKAGKYNTLNVSGDADEVAGDLNDVEKILNKLNISIRSSNLQFKDFDEVLDDIAQKWETLDNVSKKAIANAFAGTRQQEAFLTLMQNYNKYQDLLEVSENSRGNAERKYKSYKESLAAAKTRRENAFQELVNSSNFSNFLILASNAFTKIIELAPTLLKYLLAMYTVYEDEKIRRGNSVFQRAGSLANSHLGWGNIKDAYTNAEGGFLDRIKASLQSFTTNLTDSTQAAEKAELEKARSAKEAADAEAVKAQSAKEGVEAEQQKTELAKQGAESEQQEAQASTVGMQAEQQEAQSSIVGMQAEQQEAQASATGVGAGGSIGKTLSYLLSHTGMAYGMYNFAGTTHHYRNSDGERVSVTSSERAQQTAGITSALVSFIPYFGTGLAAVLGPFVAKIIDAERDRIQEAADNANKITNTLQGVSADINALEEVAGRDDDAAITEQNEIIQNIIDDLYSEENKKGLDALTDQLRKSGVIGSGSSIYSVLKEFSSNTTANQEEIIREIKYNSLEVQKQNLDATYEATKISLSDELNSIKTLISLGSWTDSPEYQKALQDYNNYQNIWGSQVYSSIDEYAADQGIDLYGNSSMSYFEGINQEIQNKLNESGNGYQKAADYLEEVASEYKAREDADSQAVDILDSLKRAYSQQAAEYDKYIDNQQKYGAQQAILKATNSAGINLSNLSTRQLEDMGAQGIYDAISQSIIDNNLTELEDLNNKIGGDYRDSLINLLNTYLREDTELWSAITGKSKTLNEAVQTLDPEKQFERAVLQNFADVFGTTIEELDQYTSEFGTLKLSELMYTSTEVNENIGKLNSLLGQMSSGTESTAIWMATLVEQYPELLKYTNNTSELFSNIIDKMQQLSNVYVRERYNDYATNQIFYRDTIEKALGEQLGSGIVEELKKYNVSDLESLTNYLTASNDSVQVQAIEEILKPILNDYSITNDLLKDSVIKIINYQEKMLQKQVDSLNAQKEALEQINEQRKYEKDIVSAQQKILDLQQNKNRVWREGVGWTYSTDQKALLEAQEALDELQNKKVISKLETQIQESEAQIKILQEISTNTENEALQEFYESWVNDYGSKAFGSTTSVVGSLKAQFSGTNISLSSLYDEYKNNSQQLNENLFQELANLEQLLAEATSEEDKEDIQTLYNEAWENGYDRGLYNDQTTFEAWKSLFSDTVTTVIDKVQEAVSNTAINNPGETIDPALTAIFAGEEHAQAVKAVVETTAEEEKTNIFKTVGNWFSSLFSRKNSKGSLSYAGGTTLLNENGTEAIVTPMGTITSLPSKSGIVPADITKNLWQLGELAPSIAKTLMAPNDVSNAITKDNISSIDESFKINTINMNVNADDTFDIDAFVQSIKARSALTKHN